MRKLTMSEMKAVNGGGGCYVFVGNAIYWNSYCSSPTTSTSRK